MFGRKIKFRILKIECNGYTVYYPEFRRFMKWEIILKGNVRSYGLGRDWRISADINRMKRAEGMNHNIDHVCSSIREAKEVLINFLNSREDGEETEVKESFIHIGWLEFDEEKGKYYEKN